jgi:hypothetical protein
VKAARIAIASGSGFLWVKPGDNFLVSSWTRWQPGRHQLVLGWAIAWMVLVEVVTTVLPVPGDQIFRISASLPQG